MENKEMKGGVFNEYLLINIFLTGCRQGKGVAGQPNSDSCRPGDKVGSKITENVQTCFMDGTKIEHHKISKLLNDSTGSTFVTRNLIEINNSLNGQYL